MSVIACVVFHFAHRFVSFSVVALILWFSDAWLTKKWFGAKDSMSLGLLATGVSGRLSTLLSVSSK